MNKWSELLNMPYPECKMTGSCCRYSSPSVPAIELFQKAAKGNEFARDFLSVFIPYSNIEEVKKINPHIVEKNLKAIETIKCGSVNADNLVFYHCRFLDDDNKCLVYEDRPSLCRDFPDSPYLVFAPGCAYEEWSLACKEKYRELKLRIEARKEELRNLKYQRRCIRLLKQLNRINNEEYKLAFLLPSINLVSPGTSWMKIF